ncbi:uncharacterized protein SETTUDRAFT_103274 [Exserohilum turcica Et28A]|uniref:RING-type domain-containing protein n=1 Tax=Exserohilum turcicum (strain 28A) TaxID=671987 RepID=R0J021_EXST2|nr:uncharacterized protein SETTUDRAFT_103274 [Exserohilum turcica Et28A]EOA90355.1 hypothetical protein SETTUDRAFT_103274 [Exserohilum turcica Et28A]
MSAASAHPDDDGHATALPSPSLSPSPSPPPDHAPHDGDGLTPDSRASSDLFASDPFLGNDNDNDNDNDNANANANANDDASTAAARLDDFYRAPPLPYTTGFFDQILNPAGLDHARYSPFDWRPLRPLEPDMPPATRAHAQPPPASPRPDRLANGYVDLTSAPDSPPRTRKRQSPTPGPSAKRQKRDDGAANEASPHDPAPAEVHEVDLTEKSPVQQVVEKQREDAAKAQTKPDETATTFNSFNCVICMDNPTDLTATACGHLFCHTCLMEALIAGENRTGPHETKRSQCPVCRKTISRNKASDVIPLLLKKGLSTQPRKKKAVAPAVATVPKVS